MAVNGPSPDNSSKSENPNSNTTQDAMDPEIERLQSLSLQENQRRLSAPPAEKNEQQPQRRSFLRPKSISWLSGRGGSAITAAASPTPVPSSPPPSRAQTLEQLKTNHLNLLATAKKIEEELQKLQPQRISRMGGEIASLPGANISSLEETLVLLCSATSSERNYKIDNLIGLSEIYRFQDLLLHFLTLFSRFSLAEQCQGLRLLSDLILHDRFNNEYIDPDFFKQLKPLFEPHFVRLSPLFEKMVAAKSQGLLLHKTLASLNFFEGTKHLKSFAELFPATLKNSEIEKKAHAIAQELRAVSLQFREIHPSEFRNKAWEDANTKMLTSPTLVQQLTLSNKISCFLIDRILSAQTPTQRRYVVKLIILILKDLTDEKQLLDFNSGMAVLASLNMSYVTRLNLISELKEKYQNIFNHATALFSEAKNFHILRAQSRCPRCIPFLGVILRDITFAHDGNPTNLLKRAETKAPIYTELYSHLDALNEIRDIVPQTNLLQALNDTPKIEDCDQRFTELSERIKPKTTPSVLFEDAPTFTPIYAAASGAITPLPPSLAAAAPAPLLPPSPLASVTSALPSSAAIATPLLPLSSHPENGRAANRASSRKSLLLRK